MSSQQVQFLQRQVERKNAQIQVLLAALDGCEREKDLSESVACAFAWDLGVSMNERMYEDAPYGALDKWNGALKAVEEAGK